MEEDFGRVMEKTASERIERCALESFKSLKTGSGRFHDYHDDYHDDDYDDDGLS